MWITAVLVFLTVIFPSNAQEVTNFDTQTVTDTTQPNQGVKWDSTGPPVTISIRPNSVQRPQGEVARHPLFYSNQWQPLLMTIGLNNFGDDGRGTNREDNANLPFVPTLLRRPDSDLNRTSSMQQNFNDYRQQFPPVPLPMPMPPVAPMFFYPPQPNYFSTGSSYGVGGSSLLQNATAETARATASSVETSMRDFPRDAAPLYGSMPDVSERYHPFNFQRFGNGFMSQEFSSPYSILPNSNENILHPLLYPYASSHAYVRETGPEIIESIAGGPSVPQREAPSASDIEDHENETSGTPSGSASTFLPPESFPLPIRAFPFGVLPPPFLHPMLSNAGVLGDIPLRPLVQPPNLLKESLVTDAIVSQGSISTNLPVETPPNALPPVDSVLPDSAVSAAVDSNSEITIAGEKTSSEKIPYEFGFDMNDGKGTDQHRKEMSDMYGTVTGSYGYRDPFGVYRLVNYIADRNGFRAVVKSNEPGVANSGSADVIVLAEQPPPQAVAEGQKPEAIIIPEASTDLTAEGSATTPR